MDDKEATKHDEVRQRDDKKRRGVPIEEAKGQQRGDKEQIKSDEV